jgi:hypothetical protein
MEETRSRLRRPEVRRSERKLGCTERIAHSWAKNPAFCFASSAHDGLWDTFDLQRSINPDRFFARKLCIMDVPPV